MTDAFAAGAVQALTKLAVDPKFRTMRAALRHPSAAGAVVGGAMGMAASPSDDRWRFVPHGTVAGAILGPQVFRGRGRGTRAAVSGPRTPAAAPAHRVV